METTFIFEYYVVEIKETWNVQGAVTVPEIKIIKMEPINVEKD